MVGIGRHQLGWGEEEVGIDRNSLGVGAGLVIKRVPGRKGGVEGGDRVEWIRVEWFGRVTPPIRTTCRNQGRRIQ